MLSAHKDRFDGIVLSTARRIAALGISPNALTILGFLGSIVTGAALALGQLSAALVFLALTSVLDALDGAVARISNRATEFGAFFDSLLDRYADALILLGLVIYLRDHYLLLFVVLVGTLLVSYSRAKVEALKCKGDIGIAERAERLIILMLAILLEIRGIDAFYPALLILAVVTHVTVLQRALYIRTELLNKAK
ncbi:MAG: CDP-alcohol phosphatidyltransferase family protein [Candidatus Hydrothermarchaeales archaeon]